MSRKKCPKCKRDTWSEKFKACSSCGFKVTDVTLATEKITPVTAGDMTNDGHVTPVTQQEKPVTPVMPGEICPTCGQPQWPTLQDHECDDECQEEEHKSIRCMLRIVPEPGEDCALCDERKPSEAALKQRAWRARKR